MDSIPSAVQNNSQTPLGLTFPISKRKAWGRKKDPRSAGTEEGLCLGLLSSFLPWVVWVQGGPCQHKAYLTSSSRSQEKWMYKGARPDKRIQKTL